MAATVEGWLLGGGVGPGTDRDPRPSDCRPGADPARRGRDYSAYTLFGAGFEASVTAPSVTVAVTPDGHTADPLSRDSAMSGKLILADVELHVPVHPEPP